MKSTSGMFETLLGGGILCLGLMAAFFTNYAFAQDGSWATKASMPTARSLQMTGVMNGQLFVLGVPGGNAGAVLEAYNPVTDSWITKTPASTPRLLAAAGVIDGKLYVAGGCLHSDCRIGITDILEVYDAATDTWAFKTPMPTPRGNHAAAAIDGKLYVVGGFPACPSCEPQFATLEVYDSSTDSWAAKASMPLPREGAGAAAISGKLYVVGGFVRPDNVWVGTLEVYDPATDTWETKTSMPTTRANAQVGVINGKLHVVGGSNIVLLGTHEVYDPITDTWATEASLPTERGQLAAGDSVVDGKLYVAGGVECIPAADCFLSNVLEVFAPEPVLISVDLDIKPGSSANRINPRSKGKIPVAILTTDSFDASTVDPSTVSFGAMGTEAAPVHFALEDVDGDGNSDMLLHFKTQATGIQCGDTAASLKGGTFGGQQIEGSDSVDTTGCEREHSLIRHILKRVF